jgi:hypothetical protein
MICGALGIEEILDQRQAIWCRPDTKARSAKPDWLRLYRFVSGEHFVGVSVLQWFQLGPFRSE